MQRSSIIATVVAAGGILVAGSVASVAVINASSMNTPESTSVTLVADEKPVTESTGESELDSVDAPSAYPDEASAPAELPAIEPEPLPAVPTIDDQPATEQDRAPIVAPQPQVTSAQPSAEPSEKPSRKPQRKPSPKPSASSTPSAAGETVEVREIAGEKAVDLVLQATGGGVVQSLEKTERGGYAAFAVRVLRHDGSIVTGFVERTSGVVFDWQVNQEAPTPSASAGSTGGYDDDDEHESESDDD